MTLAGISFAAPDLGGVFVGRRALEGKRILIVEDEYFIADDIGRELEREGACIIGPVASVESACGLLASGVRVDAAILDINVRGELVYPVARHLRLSGTPFMFATGYGAIAAEYADAPQWTKPFNTEALAAAVAELLGSGRISQRCRNSSPRTYVG